MNFEAKWWLVITTVIGNFWFLSAIPKKRTSLKQRWKKDTRSSNDEIVKKVRKLNLIKNHRLFITLCFCYVNKSMQHTIAIDSSDGSLRQLMKKQRWKANKNTGSELPFQNGDIEVTKAAKLRWRVVLLIPKKKKT